MRTFEQSVGGASFTANLVSEHTLKKANMWHEPVEGIIASITTNKALATNDGAVCSIAELPQYVPPGIYTSAASLEQKVAYFHSLQNGFFPMIQG